MKCDKCGGTGQVESKLKGISMSDLGRATTNGCPDYSGTLAVEGTNIVFRMGFYTLMEPAFKYITEGMNREAK